MPSFRHTLPHLITRHPAPLLFISQTFMFIKIGFEIELGITITDGACLSIPDTTARGNVAAFAAQPLQRSRQRTAAICLGSIRSDAQGLAAGANHLRLGAPPYPLRLHGCASHNTPRIGRVVMARSRDAGGVPITMAFEQSRRRKFAVPTHEVQALDNAAHTV